MYRAMPRQATDWEKISTNQISADKGHQSIQRTLKTQWLKKKKNKQSSRKWIKYIGTSPKKKYKRDSNQAN